VCEERTQILYRILDMGGAAATMVGVNRVTGLWTRDIPISTGSRYTPRTVMFRAGLGKNA